MLVGSCFRSIPQILRIMRARSASGVSLSANISELLAYSIAVAYNLRLGAERTISFANTWLLAVDAVCAVAGVSDTRRV